MGNDKAKRNFCQAFFTVLTETPTSLPNIYELRCPRNHFIHYGQEFVAPRLLTLGTEFNVRKAQLEHDREREVSNNIQTINRASSSMNSGTFSENP